MECHFKNFTVLNRVKIFLSGWARLNQVLKINELRKSFLWGESTWRFLESFLFFLAKYFDFFCSFSLFSFDNGTDILFNKSTSILKIGNTNARECFVANRWIRLMNWKFSTYLRVFVSIFDLIGSVSRKPVSHSYIYLQKISPIKPLFTHGYLNYMLFGGNMVRFEIHIFEITNFWASIWGITSDMNYLWIQLWIHRQNYKNL